MNMDRILDAYNPVSLLRANLRKMLVQGVIRLLVRQIKNKSLSLLMEKDTLAMKVELKFNPMIQLYKDIFIVRILTSSAKEIL